jgi:hypothetical protein
MGRRPHLFLILVAVVFIIVGCGTAGERAAQLPEDQTTVATGPVPTMARPTATPVPTDTSVPAATPIPPTDTPIPPTETNTPTPSPTNPPTATPSPTALPEELKSRILNSYSAIVLIQLDAEGINEIAAGRVSGELASFQAGIMRFAVAAMIQGVEEAIPELDPPEPLMDAWNDALGVHEATKDVLRRWFNDEIDSEQVLTEMPPILQAAEAAAGDAEEAIERAYAIDAEELRAKREEVVREFETLFSPTPTP